ncbi:MAG TPA: metallophosphoesterase [Terriglobales bacterium]|nr:metallophosphoesterase [Terriglobales bacterium]
MKRLGRTVGTCVLALAVFGSAAEAAPAGPSRQAAAESARFREGNLARVRAFLNKASGPAALDDYYFVLIGDIQNSPRNLSHDVFEAIAGDIEKDIDPKTGARYYDRIRFVILLGDMVEEGTGRRQWEALARAFSGRDPDGRPYPHIAALVRDKPIFPALGNHEILSFRFHPQTRYKDLFDSPRGVANFKDFFDWDEWVANPHVLYPVPSELAAEAFRTVLGKLADPAGRGVLEASYRLGDDGRYRLKFYDHPSLNAEDFERDRNRLAAELAPLFRKAGYGTLPVLNSDNMICYAFEAGGAVYLVLDSMSRGWHYPVFAGLKQALYPAKKDQHRLNLYTLSPYNGQEAFAEAVMDYARERGETLIPMMHHSFFNTARNPYSLGIEYNSWLGLGLPQTPQEKGDPTLMDEILFSGAPVFFSACVHRYERFTITTKEPGRPDHSVRWYVSGGGGGPFKAGPIMNTTIRMRERLYNAKLSSLTGPGSGRSVEVGEPDARFGHHYLLVHVRGGRVEDITPRFIGPEDLPQKRWEPQLALAASCGGAPDTGGAALEFSPGAWSAQRFNRFLNFVSWRPSVSLGVVRYNLFGNASEPRSGAARVEVSPLTLECHLPRANIVTLRLLGFEYWAGRADLRRAFLTTGLEMPLVYDLTGRAEKLNFGLKALFPLRAGAASDPGFGARMKVEFVLSYRVRL